MRTTTSLELPVTASALAPRVREFFERAFAAGASRRPSSTAQLVEHLRAALM